MVALHRSHSLPPPQWFEIETSGDHLITCDDFVIPASENRASLKLVHTPGPYAAATRIARQEESLHFAHCCQEAAMWDAFATCARADDGAAAGVYVDAMVKTHACLMAVVRACEEGKDVAVPPLEAL